jgi:hypothetical protein
MEPYRNDTTYRGFVELSASDWALCARDLCDRGIVTGRILRLRPGWYSDGIGMQGSVRKKSLYLGDTSDMNLTADSGQAVDRPRHRDAPSRSESMAG